jgi:hypothetical protein
MIGSVDDSVLKVLKDLRSLVRIDRSGGVDVGVVDRLDWGQHEVSHLGIRVLSPT